MKITEVTTLREFVHLGRLLPEGTEFKVPSELDEDTALGWVKGKLADGVFEKEPVQQPKKKGPAETRVSKPDEDRKKGGKDDEE